MVICVKQIHTYVCTYIVCRGEYGTFWTNNNLLRIFTDLPTMPQSKYNPHYVDRIYANTPTTPVHHEQLIIVGDLSLWVSF